MPTPRRTRLYLVACVALAMLVATSHVWCLSPLHRAGVDAVQFQLDLERLEEHIDILHGWFRRAGRRPRYSRREKLLILEHAERFSLSAAQLARDFLLSPATAFRWLKQRRAVGGGAAPQVPDPPKPVPPSTRICDSRRQAVGDMAVAGFHGDRTIERSLLHQGERISARSVGRIRAEPRRPSVAEPLAKKKSKEISDSPCSVGDVVDEPGFVPRIGRLVRVLADAFIQGIGGANLRLLGEIEDWDERDALLAFRARLRSRRAGQLAILLSRVARIPPGRRPHFNPAERARILDLKCGHRLSNRTLAPWFLVDEDTLSHWSRDVDHPEQRKRPLVPPLPDMGAAVAGVDDSLRFVPKRLRSLVTDALARLAARTPVRKPRRRKGRKADGPARAATCAPRKLSPIRARCPNHWWSCDLTTIELLHQFYLACVIDLYSRRVLAWDLYPGQPNAQQIQALFARAAAEHGTPKHVVTDHEQPDQNVCQQPRQRRAQHVSSRQRMRCRELERLGPQPAPHAGAGVGRRRPRRPQGGLAMPRQHPAWSAVARRAARATARCGTAPRTPAAAAAARR